MSVRAAIVILLGFAAACGGSKDDPDSRPEIRSYVVDHVGPNLIALRPANCTKVEKIGTWDPAAPSTASTGPADFACLAKIPAGKAIDEVSIRQKRLIGKVYRHELDHCRADGITWKFATPGDCN